MFFSTPPVQPFIAHRSTRQRPKVRIDVHIVCIGALDQRQSMCSSANLTNRLLCGRLPTVSSLGCQSCELLVTRVAQRLRGIAYTKHKLPACLIVEP